jgi:histidine triad (HIT) family protein
VTTENCVFCKIANGAIPAETVYEDEQCIVFLDNTPLFAGHCLVCPKQHYDTLMDVPSALLQPLFENAQVIARAVETGLGAEGSFIAINNRISQSVPHLHVHVVPRRPKDGMKGFFWPRRPYRDKEEMRETADALRKAVTSLRSNGA